MPVLGMGLLPGYREDEEWAGGWRKRQSRPLDNGIERIELQVFASNERTIALYRGLRCCRSILAPPRLKACAITRH